MSDRKGPTATERPGDDSRSVADLLSDITSDMAALLRDEVALAKKEIQQTIRTAVKDGVYVLVGGTIAYIGVLALTAAAILALAEVVAPWLSALIVGGAVTLVGAIMLLRGVSEIRSLGPTDRTVENVKSDAETLREHLPAPGSGSGRAKGKEKR